MNSPSDLGTTVLGYPRIGPDRELKKAVEGYWAGSLDRAGLVAVGAGLRRDTWTTLRDAGLDSVPGNTFSWYDHVLDAARTVGAVPARYAAPGLDGLDTLFAMARGHGDVPPLELTKFFDTNYHYLVPELGPDTVLHLADRKPIEEFREARALGVRTRPVLLGPVTFLLLAKPAADAPAGFSPLDLLEPLIEVYRELLRELARAGADWVQLDEPAFAPDRTAGDLAALERAYSALGSRIDRPQLLVTCYYGRLGSALPVLAASPVEAIGLDLVAGADDLDAAASLGALRDKTVLAGVVDGRNVWRTDLDAALTAAATLLGSAGRVEIGTSCPLLHVPYDLDREPGLAPEVRDRLAFARQKLDEVVTIGRALRGDAVDLDRTRVPAGRRDDRVRARLDALGSDHYRRGDADRRAAAQRAHLRLGPVPTTTIGSFPQTGQIRSDRAAHRAGRLDDAGYEQRMRAEIERVVRLQEDIGLDVLVHGEPERNDRWGMEGPTEEARGG